MNITAIVLGAGASTRLGALKQFIVFKNETLLERAIRLGVAACPGRVVAVLSPAAEPLVALEDTPGVRVAVNPAPERGIGSSLKTALGLVGDDQDGVLILLCDQPLITVGHLRALVASFAANPNAPVATGYAVGEMGVPAAFPRRCFSAIRKLPDDAGAQRLLRAEAALRVVPFPEAALDVDTPADLEKLRKLEQS